MEQARSAGFQAGLDLTPGLRRGGGCGRRAESSRQGCGSRSASGLHQRLDAIAVEALTRSEGFGRQAAVDGRLNAQYKLAAEFLFAQWVRHFLAVRVNQFNHFFHRRAKFGVNLCLVLPVNAAQIEFGVTTNEALVFIAPLDEFRVARRPLFDMFTCQSNNVQ